jgi:pimeloyl-ACP methyl ester carboxylesterase
MSVSEIVLDAGGLELSARFARAQGSPAATVLALPGGGYLRNYWDNPVDARGSLLQLGASLGYNVIAVDRPGYGRSAGLPDDQQWLDPQAERLSQLLSDLGRTVDVGAGVFLIGHSMGGILSLLIAALQRNPNLLGVDVSGVPRRFTLVMEDAVRSSLEQLRKAPVIAAGEEKAPLFYGPLGSYDPRMIAAEDQWSAACPPNEMEDGTLNWPGRFADIAARINVPVQYTLGEFEMVTDNSLDAMAATAKEFTASPRVVVHRQVLSSHNISLHHVARAFHMRAFAFFDEAIVAHNMR